MQMAMQSVQRVWESLNRKFSWEFGVVLCFFALIGVFNKEFTYIGFQNVYITEFVLGILCLSILFRQTMGEVGASFLKKDYLIFGLLAGLGLIHCWFSRDYGFSALRHGMIVFYFLFFLVTFQLAITRFDQLKTLLYAILFISTFINSLKIIYFKFNNVYLNQYEQFRVNHSEVDILGAAISIIILLVLYKKLAKGFSFTCLALNLALILFATKRTAVLGLSLCAIVYCILNYQKLNLKKTLYTVAIIGGIVAIILLISTLCYPQQSADYSQFLLQKLNVFKESNTTWRMQAWNVAWQKFASHPWWGIGFGKPIIDSPVNNVNTYDPHNSFLALITRTGIVGGVLLIVLLAQTITLYIKEYFRETQAERKDVILILFLMFLFMITFAFFNVALENQYQGIYFYFSLAGIYLIRNIKGLNQTAPHPAKTRISRVWFTVVTLVYLCLVMSPLNYPKSLIIYDSGSLPRTPNIYKCTGAVIKKNTNGQLLIHVTKANIVPKADNYLEWDLPLAFLKSNQKMGNYLLEFEFDKRPRRQVLLAVRPNTGVSHQIRYSFKSQRSAIPLTAFGFKNQPINRMNIKSISFDFWEPVDTDFSLKRIGIVRQSR